MWQWIKKNPITTAIISGFIFIIVGYIAYTWNKRLKELAKYKTKLEQREVEEKQKFIEASMNKTKEEIDKLEEAAIITVTAIAMTKKAVEQQEKKYLDKIEEIRTISTWDELQKYREQNP